MATLTEIKTAIATTLDRTDLTSSIPTWITSAHRHYQRMYNFDFMKGTNRKLASEVTDSYLISLSSATIKAPRFLCRVEGTDLLAPLIPSVGLGLDPFYQRIEYEEILALRANANANGRLTDQTQRRFYAFETHYVHIFPRNNVTTDHFAFAYYRYMSPPTDDSYDWLFVNFPDAIIYRSLLEALPFLGEVDERALTWKELLLVAERGMSAHVADYDFMGDSLVMRG